MYYARVLFSLNQPENLSSTDPKPGYWGRDCGGRIRVCLRNISQSKSLLTASDKTFKRGSVFIKSIAAEKQDGKNSRPLFNILCDLFRTNFILRGLTTRKPTNILPRKPALEPINVEFSDELSPKNTYDTTNESPIHNGYKQLKSFSHKM